MITNTRWNNSTSGQSPASLKLRPSGAIEIRLLLFLLRVVGSLPHGQLFYSILHYDSRNDLWRLKMCEIVTDIKV